MIKFSQRLFQIAGILASLLLISPLLIGDHWLIELLSHLRFHISLGLLILSFFFLLLKLESKEVILIFTLATLGLMSSLNLFDVSSSKNNLSSSLKLCTINLYSSNENIQGLKSSIQETRPDVIFFQEYNNYWHGQLRLLEDYRFRKYKIQEGNFGIATYSRIPFDSDEVIYFSEKRFPAISSTINKNETKIELVNVHMEPPGHPRSHEIRKEYFKNLTEYLSNIENEFIIAGDFNATNYSPLIKSFVEKLNLNQFNQFGIEAKTWPSRLGIFGICIDHIISSAGLEICNKETLKDWGSDHVPVLAEICVN